MLIVPKVLYIVTDGSSDSINNVGYGAIFVDFKGVIRQLCGRLSPYASS